MRVETRVKTLIEYLNHQPAEADFFRELKTLFEQSENPPNLPTRFAHNLNIFRAAVAKALCLEYLMTQTPQEIHLVDNLTLITAIQNLRQRFFLDIPDYNLSFYFGGDKRFIYPIPDAISMSSRNNHLFIDQIHQFNVKLSNKPFKSSENPPILQNIYATSVLKAALSNIMNIEENLITIDPTQQIPINYVAAYSTNPGPDIQGKFVYMGHYRFGQHCKLILDRIIKKEI